VPLPFVERRQDATPVHPPDPWALAVFDAPGRALPVADIALFDVHAAASARMGSCFGRGETALTRARAQGLPETEARACLATLFANLGQVPAGSQNPPATLCCDHSTPGGMNAQVRARLAAAGAPLALTRALDPVLDRIRGH
jgi:pyrroline-5-carboxylate reductase